jgi:hypothetical protein
METRRKGKAIIGIAMAAIMVASVLAVMVGSVGAYSNTGKYNIIEKDDVATVQSVLIGQSLDFFTNWGKDKDNTVTIYRVKDNAVEWTRTADPGNTLKVVGSDWLKDGAYYVNYRRDGLNRSVDAQLSFSEPEMPLEIKVGTKKVASIAVGTKLTIDTEGMNLFSKDQVDLVVIGPDGQIKYDKENNQAFTDITVADLVEVYGKDNLETAGWTIGSYTFKVKTDSEYACGLEAESGMVGLAIIKGAVSIEADKTSAVELAVVKLIVSGVSGDPINVSGDSKNVEFKSGVDDTPLVSYTKDGYPYFNTYIDDDGIRKYAVEFVDTGSYTLKVTVTDGDRKGDYDTVDITVLEKEVVFDLPSTVVIGDMIDIRGTATSGTYVSVYVDDVLYKKLDNMVIQNGEFWEEVKTTDVGMNVPGSVRLKAWIDCRGICKAEDPPKVCMVPIGQNSTTIMPTKSADGDDAILLTTPSLTAELSSDVVATEDDFTVFGTAEGSTQVTILSVPPKGGGGNMYSAQEWTDIGA